ncbi:MAG TPA: nucleotidyltransferase domain-containing protein, partial [Phototrophicaceae bacterium]|nr:nucleotidyltransferase domain-containing protein [Phototrophicaceae bacterium]
IALKRPDFTIRNHFTDPQAPEPLSEFNLYNCVIFRCVVGSRAYGLDHEDSDVDRRGIYLPPAELHWSLFGIPEQLEYDETQECYWELQKFITLALKANPNVLECLYTPLIDHVSPIAQELLDQREIFLSKLVYQTYNGYVMSQFRKMQHHLQNYGTIKWKHAMHLIRLLISGITALRDGYIPVQVEEHREQLLAIRHEKVAWKEVNAWRLSLHKTFDEAFQQTKLPDRPDYERANDYLVKARRSMVS